MYSSVQSLSRVQLFATPWTAERQASLSITNSWSLPKVVSIESVMPSNHLILCHPLLLLPSIFPSIRVFCSESVLRIRWPKDWNFSFSISPPSEYSGLTSFRMDWCAPQAPMLQYTLGRHHHFPKGFLYFLALPPWVLHFAALSNPGHLFCAPGTTESRD